MPLITRPGGRDDSNAGADREAELPGIWATKRRHYDEQLEMAQLYADMPEGDFAGDPVHEHRKRYAPAMLLDAKRRVADMERGDPLVVQRRDFPFRDHPEARDIPFLRAECQCQTLDELGALAVMVVIYSDDRVVVMMSRDDELDPNFEIESV
jgi:hypothetical protein